MSEPTPPVQIRPALDTDLDALLALEERSFNGDRLSRRQYRRHLRSATACILTASREHQLIGSALVLFRRTSRAARLYSLAIDAAARGQGIGRLLLNAVEQHAGQRGCDRVRLEVRDDNAAARALYERSGYRRHGQRARYYEDGANAILYEKSLE
ncbi:ribosomal protein S18-alanine N-acetyltransferase [Oleiagrimonas sp. MCCC 1A03011]|uniref:ribosomal protein S18-alanine N-acetyltransferase n=1 Tax=Oleiagrimonas sp. MCCC 1A03011 TaxID=1926883 RepID=UPI000DC4C091|nr:ribosomal protein S18-alanine N-acetyltransferase [Oleiagrimonas sp. MCCC 1A03011]RAP57146.1 ribosomal-protein-alanine N-acetyltransferase [Oleiagrimonas sp. MCCC 1A03011]